MSQQEQEGLSLAHGAELSADTWTDFVTRLHHDCAGAGVRDHGTADAIFIVERLQPVYGIDLDYGSKRVILWDGSEWFSPQEYWDHHSDDEVYRAELDRIAQGVGKCAFLDLDEDDQWELLADLDEHTVTGYDERWEYVNSHMTREAAEAFIRRKKHDYRRLRVAVEAQTYCWEYNTIKQAILDGRLVPAGGETCLAADYDALQQRYRALEADRKSCWAEFKVAQRMLDDGKRECDTLRAEVERLKESGPVAPTEQPKRHEGALNMVHCACGDAYPAGSYGAGFIDGSGMCENCDAAIPALDIAPPAVELPVAEECPQCAGTGYDCPDCIAAAEHLYIVPTPRELLHELRAFTLEYDSGKAGVLRGLIDKTLRQATAEKCRDVPGKEGDA